MHLMPPSHALQVESCIVGCEEPINTCIHEMEKMGGDTRLLGIVGISSFYLHEVTMLGHDDSKKLFNWHAFPEEEAPKNFEDLVHIVSKACGGLPLALEVVGSSLRTKRSNWDRKSLWLEAGEALKQDSDVMNALNWSYNCLSELEKLMFVDIAYIFYGWKKKRGHRN